MEPLIPRLPGENSKWYSRFLVFLSMAPSRRSATEVYRIETARQGPINSLPGSWKVAISRFQWRERAESFDSQRAEEETRAFGDLRRQEARRRFDLLRRTRITLQRVLKRFANGSGLNHWTVSDFLKGVSLLIGAEREEQRPGMRLTVELSPEEYTRRVRQEFSGAIGFIGTGADVMTQDDPE